jgi:hypothetical protein
MKPRHGRERKNSDKLIKFLNIDNAKMSAQTCLKRGRSDEAHWTTDDETITHQGRIGYGAVGDVHKVCTHGVKYSNNRCIIPSPNRSATTFLH